MEQFALIGAKNESDFLRSGSSTIFDSPLAMPDTVLEAALQIAVGGPTAVAVNLGGQIEA